MPSLVELSCAYLHFQPKSNIELRYLGFAWGNKYHSTFWYWHHNSPLGQEGFVPNS